MSIGIRGAVTRGAMRLSGVAAALVALTCNASAQTLGRAADGQASLLEGVSPIAREIDTFHNLILLPLIIAISLFVLVLLIYVIFKFNEKANPVPAKTTHHAGLEVAWTIVPVLILVAIAIPSFRLLTHQLVLPEADVTVKATGKQWYWSYAYPRDASGAGGFEFDSNILDQTKLPAGKLRLLDVDNEAVVPVNKVVRLQVTADAVGVIHSFVLQSLGARIDAVPGRLNETWFKAEKEGVYYGQCSKLCGKDHAFMPIVFRVVSEDAYREWLAQAAKTYASIERPVQLADAASAARQ